MLRLGKFGTCLYSFIIEKSLMHKLCTAGLNGKIVLGKCDFGLTRVAILRHKIASVACQHHVIYLTLSAFGKTYHFPGVGKMISCYFTCILTRFLSAGKYIFESFPFGITQKRVKFTGTPALNAVIFDSDGFKNC